MDYNRGEPSSYAACACEAERLLNRASQASSADAMSRLIDAAGAWARLAQAAAIREAASTTTAEDAQRSAATTDEK